MKELRKDIFGVRILQMEIQQLYKNETLTLKSYY